MPETTCPDPTCRLPAVQETTRDLDRYLHEVTGTCKRGHLWTTKWFAAEEVDA